MRTAVSTLVLASSLVFAAPSSASAQSYESPFRFGLGLDYAGLFGRGDGGAGGLRLQIGARLHENFALYYQGQALGGAFVSSDEALAAVLGWNAVLAEFDVSFFQFGVGPSVDVTVFCSVSVQADGGASAGCTDQVAPGLAARAAVRFGVFVLSADLHASFNEPSPDVWGGLGIGFQIGDVQRRPIPFPVNDREASTQQDPEEDTREAELSVLPRRVVRPAPGRLADALQRPYAPSPSPAPRPRADAPERGSPPVDRMRPPSVRRFRRDDVRTPARVSRGRRDEPSPDDASGVRARHLREGLDYEDSDDPLQGLEDADAPGEGAL